MTSILVATSACGHLFYQPDRRLYVTPERVGLKYEEATFTAKDGTPLTAWVIPGEGDPHGTIVQFHGNAENLTSHFLQVGWLARAGFNVVAFDYRGYGRSGGEPSREGLVEDGVAVIDWARSRPELARNLFVVGQSLGGAVAVPSVVRAGETGVRAVVLDSTFASYRQMTRIKLGQIWLTWPLQWPLSFLVGDDLSPVDEIAQLHVPKLFLHGDDDPVVPYRAVEDLVAAASEPKEVWHVAEPGHLSALTAESDAYRRRLVTWLCRHLESARPGCGREEVSVSVLGDEI